MKKLLPILLLGLIACTQSFEPIATKPEQFITWIVKEYPTTSEAIIVLAIAADLDTIIPVQCDLINRRTPNESLVTINNERFCVMQVWVFNGSHEQFRAIITSPICTDTLIFSGPQYARKIERNCG